MELKKMYDNTYVRLAVITPALCYAGPKVAEIPPPDFNIGHNIQCFCDDYKINHAQLAALGLIGVTLGWGAVGIYNEMRRHKKEEKKEGLEKLVD